ncbi:glycosyl hydrolase family 57 [Balneicella halophila]|uniref:Glycosyl hydrolase family 57 n=1 Tax=Balneicella halophila TaxID=1537566 RepID=A0A7L4UN23_BALHA|nr:glycoside hydrolase family 57 protein [Balneicella halophila]PVX49939.1 glycosyl hydrolase family 57 [Balneicella halophila]
MKNICLYFQVHQPFRFKKYSFFDMGKEHYYYDDFLNESVMRKVAEKCYLPANNLLLKLIEQNKGEFKVTFSISGTALDQFELYAPEVLESFQKLAETGCVEFLAETYSHSLVSLHNKDLFKEEVKKHTKALKNLLGIKKPKVFRNTELIYSDMLGKDIFEMGFKGVLAEGAKHILGWKSPNYIYCNPLEPKLKLLLRNYNYSDDIAFRFSDTSWTEYPLTAKKFASWIASDENEESQIVNLFMDYETFGEHHNAATGIFDFLEHLPTAVLEEELKFITPSEAVSSLDTVSPMSMPYPTSWADEERDVSAWLGNEMQKEAFDKLYQLAPLIKKIDNKKLKRDWEYLQTSDAFYYMSTKWFTDGDVHTYFNPYPSAYDAFLNYMNILSDFSQEVHKLISPSNKKDDIIAELKEELKHKEKQLKEYQEIIKSL